MFKEFKEFAVKGNVVDMAIGIIIGAAFGKIISSFVADIIMPPIGLLTSGMNIHGMVLTLKDATAENPAVTINYGLFLNTIIDFILIAFSIFIVIRQLNKFKKKEAPKPVAPAEEILLLTQIRDALKKK